LKTITCRCCGIKLNADATTDLDGNYYCDDCLAKVKANTGNVSPSIAFILSLFPGLGHMYIGFIQKGLLLMIIFAGTWILGDALNGLPLPAILIFYAAFDALKTAKAVNRGEKINDFDWQVYFTGEAKRRGRYPNTSLLWGLALAAAGIILLLRNLGFYIPDLSIYWPVLLIIGGLWLIFTYIRGLFSPKANDE